MKTKITAIIVSALIVGSCSKPRRVTFDNAQTVDNHPFFNNP